MAAVADVAWTFPTNKEGLIDSFRIKISDTPGGSVVENQSAAKEVRTAEIAGTNGVSRYVKVCSLSAGVESAVTNELEVTPTIPAPTNLRHGTN